MQAVGCIFFLRNGHSAGLAMEDGLCHCWPGYLAFFMALPFMVLPPMVLYFLVAGFLLGTALALVAGIFVVPALVSFLVMALLGLDPILWCTLLVWSQSMVLGTSGSMAAHTAYGATPRTGRTFGMQWPKMALEA